MGKRASSASKKDRKSKGSRKSTESRESRKSRKSRKSSLSENDKKGKDHKIHKSSVKERASKLSKVASTVRDGPPPLPICNENIQPMDPCEYEKDGCCRAEALCRPNHYPGLLDVPKSLAVAGSESGTYDSICKLLRAGFLYADRVFAMTPWGNYVIFRAHNQENKIFFLFDGCTCNVNRFRYMDLNCGTAGLLYFDKLHDVLNYIIHSREQHNKLRTIEKIDLESMCPERCKF